MEKRKQKQRIDITKEDIRNRFIEVEGKFYRFNIMLNELRDEVFYGYRYELSLYGCQVFENGKLKFIDSNIKNYSFFFDGEKCNTSFIVDI